MLILIIFLVGLLTCDASEEVELKCPKGWSIQGQFVYSTTIQDNENGYSKTTEEEENKVAICFLCRINSLTIGTLFGMVEMCVSNSSEFQQGNSYQKQEFCQYGIENLTEVESNEPDSCLTRYSSTFCGAKVKKTTNLSEALERVQFLPCNDDKLTHSQPNTVDIQCP